MQECIQRLENLLNSKYTQLQAIPEDIMSRPVSEGKWSTKVIMGHLCDSAINNIQRFVRIQFEPQPFIITPYQQNNWVQAQHYDKMSARDIIDFWKSLNLHIVRILRSVPEKDNAIKCQIGVNADYDFLWLVRDYLDHMEHHFRQL